MAGQLRLAASGVVLRGATNAGTPTVLLATGTSRRTLLLVGPAATSAAAAPLLVSSAVLPMGATHLQLAALGDLRVGDRVLVQRPSTKEWIHDLGMDTVKAVSLTKRILHWMRR